MFQANDPLLRRLFDIVVTMPLNLLAICAFYGTWTGLDWIFHDSDVKSLDALGLNGAYCVVIKRHATLPISRCLN
jgi:hypothetical protein